MERRTKKQMFEAIRDKLTDENEINFINHEIELLSRKSASEKSKFYMKHKANETLKEILLNYMENEKRYQVKDLLKNIPQLKEATSQKITMLLYQMIDENTIRRVVDKRIAYFEKV